MACCVCGDPVVGYRCTQGLLCVACANNSPSVEMTPVVSHLWRGGRDRCFYCFRRSRELKWHPFWKESTCPNCMRLPTCAACERKAIEFVDETDAFPTQRVDGMQLCGRCASLGLVVSDVHARSELVRLLEVLSDLGLRFGDEEIRRQARGIGVEITLPFDGPPQKDSDSESSSLSVSTRNRVTLRAMCQSLASVLPLFLVQSDVTDVWSIAQVHSSGFCEQVAVRRGLPLPRLWFHLAHEITHVYLALVQCPPLIHHLEEGLCNAVSELVCRAVSCEANPVAADFWRYLEYKITSATDDIYGRGYRKVHPTLSKNGLGVVLEKMQSGLWNQ
ncbi:MAG: uncharacterized protein KVP18_002705 [Porospora cf. gigantea A]|uniref:uncharacterized protein n=1 Tax=Porospora cf. gigantea A TaxID=2853593 RepID=UPI003559B1F5|nr:MAG: hypothetical protein KVP18_002705 [Porospora cf. gigantea A]